MGDVENHGAIIATDQSDHTVQNDVPADGFWLVAPLERHNFVNITTSNKLEAGRTERTVAGGAHIWTKYGELKDSWYEEDPLIERMDKADPSGALPFSPATAKKWSTDVEVEGGGVVRTGDLAWMDCLPGEDRPREGNSTGSVHAPKAEASVLLGEFDVVKTCTIVSFDGWEGASPEGARKLGPEPHGKSDEASYLEVVDSTSMTIVAVRKDTTVKGGADPQCEPQAHTYWRVVWTGPGTDVVSPNPLEGGGHNKDELTLDPKDFPNPCPSFLRIKDTLEGIKQSAKDKVEGWGAKVGDEDAQDNPLFGSGGGDEQEPEERKADEKEEKVEVVGESSEGPDGPTPAEAAEKGTLARYAEMAKAASKWKPFLEALYALWKFEQDTKTYLTVAATGCAGTKTATIRVFPSAEVEIDLFEAFGEKLEAAMSCLKTVRAHALTVAKFVPGASSFYANFELFNNPSATLTLKHEELTEAAIAEDGAKDCYAVQVGKRYKATFGFKPLLKIAFGARCTIFDFFPAIGWAGKWASELLQITANVRLELGLVVNISAWVERKPTGKYSGGGKVVMKPHLTLAIELSITKVLSCEAHVSFSGQIMLDDFHGSICKDPYCVLEGRVHGSGGVHVGGSITFNLTGKAADVVKIEGDYWPDQLQISAKEVAGDFHFPQQAWDMAS